MHLSREENGEEISVCPGKFRLVESCGHINQKLVELSCHISQGRVDNLIATFLAAPNESGDH